jgi:mediator of RNA polymerase II transcription subunit 12
MDEPIFILPEVTDLVVSPLPEGLTDLLRQRYTVSPKWTYIIWDSIVYALDRAEDGPLEQAIPHFSRLLEETGTELSLSLELESRKWFQGRGHRLLSILDERIWSIIEPILIRSVISGTLSTSTVLFGLVFPIWSRSLDDSVAPLVVPVRYVTGIARRLLIVDAPLPLPVQESDAASLLEAQRLLGQHTLIHTRQDTIRFFTAIADLVMLEDRKGMPDSERELCTSLRTLVSRSSTFRVLAMRYIEDVRNIFCRSTSIDVTGAASEDKLVETLAMLITPPPGFCKLTIDMMCASLNRLSKRTTSRALIYSATSTFKLYCH